MSIAFVSESPQRDYHIGRERDVLRRIAEPGISFALWQRSLADEVSAALAAWIDDGVLEIDRTLASEESPSIAIPELATLPPAARIQDDVEELLRELRALSGAQRIRVVLGIKTTDACRKFHTDNVRLRLITTYVGPGTDWIPAVGVDRAALQHPPDCPCDANRAIVRDPQLVRHTSPGDVLLLKGELYGGALGAVHRSPPIEERGLKRLVLAMTACV